MSRVLLLSLVLVTLTDCGIRKALIKPEDIPAYQAKLQKKRAGLQDPNAPATPEDAKAEDAPTTPSAPTVPPEIAAPVGQR